MTFLYAKPTESWLEISPTVQTQSWRQSQSYSTVHRCWGAYLNQLCLNTLLPWLKQEYTPQASLGFNWATLPSLWEWVDGAAIMIEGKKLVVIPTETIDTDELRVPQEWIDIPNWAADYYLAVQVNPDDHWVKIWGYTTHLELKTNGYYNSSDRTYSLDRDQLIQDINVLSVARQLCPNEATRAEIAPITPISPAQAENLVQRLGNPNLMFPRLAIPFEMWGALMSQDHWRDRLYQQRRQFGNQFSPLPVNLGQWFEDLFETSWQSLETLLPNSPNWAFRRGEETNEAMVQRVKQIDLETSHGHEAVILFVGLTVEADSRIGVRVQLHPSSGNTYLPAYISLALRLQTGDIMRVVEARTQDNYIQLPRFKCSPGFRFSLEITLDDQSVSEDFLI